MPEAAAIIRRFDEPDERRDFPLGRFELVQIGGMTVGRAEYEPGWRWSEHVGAATGRAVWEVAHLGLVLSGR
ncbi:MAG: cupin, partial [Candidatus Limnocylindria bacterium]